jgi:NADH-quinone oxidoreductase subunit L
VMVISLAVAFAGLLLAWLIYKRRVISEKFFPSTFPLVHKLFLNKWYFDEFYHATAVKGTLLAARALSWFDGRVIDGGVNGSAWLTLVTARFKGVFDQRVIDGAVNGIAALASWLGGKVRRLQTGLVQNYMLMISIGLSAAALYYIFKH